MNVLKKSPTRSVAPYSPVFWFYGLSGSGKTSITQKVAGELRSRGLAVLLIDGDRVRAGINRDLGFSTVDRMENIRRAAEIAALSACQGITVLAAFITPEKPMRIMAREIAGPLPFYDIFLNCDFPSCRERDTKGLYKKAAEGMLKDFTGGDATFDWPESADLMLDTKNQTLEDSCKSVLEFIGSKLVLPPLIGHIPP